MPEKEKEKADAYSYHTFIYPFLFSTKGGKDNKDNKGKAKKGKVKVASDDDKKFDLFCEELIKYSKDSKFPWESYEIMSDEENIMGDRAEGNESRGDKESFGKFQAYQAVQYFNQTARKAILGASPDICRNYRIKNINNNTDFTIVKQYKVTTKSVTLNVSDIRLMVFNTGVALLIFELEYFAVPELKKNLDNPYTNPLVAKKLEEKAISVIDDIKKINRDNVRFINEYGRRLFPEFLPAKDCTICGSSITIKHRTDNSVLSRTDYTLADADDKLINDPTDLPPLIYDSLLAFTGNSSSSNSWLRKGNSSGSDSENKFDITPAIDDRMFVCCCVCESGYTEYFRGAEKATSWNFQSDYELADELYALTNIDAGDGTCPNLKMMNDYFDSQLYLRWLDNGTLHSVTNHSMLCITGDHQHVQASVIVPFLILYVRLCCLTIAQRATLLKMDGEITTAVAAQGGSRWDDVSKLEHGFAKFQGELMLAEVTPQIQGIELYDKLQKMLFIDKLEDNIQKQLNNLYQIAEAEQEKSEKRKEKNDEKKAKRVEALLSSIGILSIFSAFADFYQFFGASVKEEFDAVIWRGSLKIPISIVLAVWAGYLIIGKIRNKNDKGD